MILSVRRRPLLRALLVLAVFAAFWPSLDNGFVNWDDPGNIVRNPMLGRFDWGFWKWAFSTTHYGHFQPLSWLSLSLDKDLWSLSASGFHLTALVLQALGALAFFSVLRLLLAKTTEADEEARDLAAFFAALLWAVHPLRVEPVAWATERRELLGTLFSLLALRAWLRDELRPALLLFFGACLSKVTSAALPFVFAVLDALLRPKVRTKALVPFLVLAGVTLALGFRAQYASGTAVPLSVFGPFDRLAQALYGPGYYLARTVWPVGLSPFVHADWKTSPVLYLPFAALTTALLAGLRGAAARPGVRAALACAFVLLAPSLGFFKSGPQTAADRFAHQPSLVLFAVLAWGLCALPRRRRAFGLCALGAAALIPLSRAQCAVWRDSVSLWSRAVASHRPAPLALQNLATALREEGREREAAAIFARFTAADPRSPAALALWGDERLEGGDAQFAAALYARALSMNADLPGVRANLGVALLRLGRDQEALQALTDAARQDPKSAHAWHNLGVVLAKAGRKDKARAAYEKALGLEPARADTKEALARLARP